MNTSSFSPPAHYRLMTRVPVPGPLATLLQATELAERATLLESVDWHLPVMCLEWVYQEGTDRRAMPEFRHPLVEVALLGDLDLFRQALARATASPHTQHGLYIDLDRRRLNPNDWHESGVLNFLAEHRDDAWMSTYFDALKQRTYQRNRSPQMPRGDSHDNPWYCLARQPIHDDVAAQQARKKIARLDRHIRDCERQWMTKDRSASTTRWSRGEQLRRIGTHTAALHIAVGCGNHGLVETLLEMGHAEVRMEHLHLALRDGDAVLTSQLLRGRSKPISWHAQAGYDGIQRGRGSKESHLLELAQSWQVGWSHWQQKGARHHVGYREQRKAFHNLLSQLAEQALPGCSPDDATALRDLLWGNLLTFAPGHAMQALCEQTTHSLSLAQAADLIDATPAHRAHWREWFLRLPLSNQTEQARRFISEFLAGGDFDGKKQPGPQQLLEHLWTVMGSPLNDDWLLPTAQETLETLTSANGESITPERLRALNQFLLAAALPSPQRGKRVRL